MKISVKIDKRKSGETNLGYPIVVYVSQNYKSKPFRTGYYTHEKNWNDKLAEPKAAHPEYYLLSDFLDEIKAQIKEVLRQSNRRRISIQEVEELIFKKNYEIFYDAVIAYLPVGCEDTRRSAINSFNAIYPKITFSELTPKMVDVYISKMLDKGNEPGGVDSYVRSLRSLWNKLSNEPNPFKGYKIEIPKKIKTVATTSDLKTLAAAHLSYRGRIGGAGRYRDYFLLMYFLGGIDPEVLAKVRYDINVVDGRLNFNRNKGGSKVACSNIIPEAAWVVLKKFRCYPYLVPIYKSKSHSVFMKNFNKRLKTLCDKLELSKPLKPKTPRYTFINRAQELLIDERITAQIVGHKRKTTTSIYPNPFAVAVQDAAHFKIIKLQ